MLLRRDSGRQETVRIKPSSKPPKGSAHNVNQVPKLSTLKLRPKWQRRNERVSWTGSRRTMPPSPRHPTLRNERNSHASDWIWSLSLEFRGGLLQGARGCLGG